LLPGAKLRRGPEVVLKGKFGFVQKEAILRAFPRKLNIEVGDGRKSIIKTPTFVIWAACGLVNLLVNVASSDPLGCTGDAVSSDVVEVKLWSAIRCFPRFKSERPSGRH